MDRKTAKNRTRSRNSHCAITTSAPKRFGRERAITTSAKTWLRCCGIFRGEPPFTLLDFGCGPGRNLKAFANSGHVAIGLEGARLVEMARQHSGCDVWLQDFLKLDLPKDFFDGIFANATLFHVPKRRIAARASGTARVSQAGRHSVQFDTARP